MVLSPSARATSSWRNPAALRCLRSELGYCLNLWCMEVILVGHIKGGRRQNLPERQAPSDSGVIC